MQLVRQGIKWSVVNGNKIKVLADYWILGIRPGSFQTLTLLPEGATVNFLFAEGHCAWDADIVCSVFEEDIVNRVLEIPIGRQGGDDFLSWPHTKWGHYIVASAYNLARTEKNHG
jgi:hypothetical protein